MFSMTLRNSLRATSVVGLALFFGTICSVSEALAQSAPTATALERAHIEEVLKGLARGKSIGQVAVAPDGKRLAWIQNRMGGTEILVAPLDDMAKLDTAKSQRVTAAGKGERVCREVDIAWAPNAKSLAFFSDCAREGEQADLYLSRLDDTPAQRLTELHGEVDAPAFSPDGTRLAFLYVEGATRRTGGLAAMKPPAGVIGEDGVEIQRVAVVPVDAARLANQA